MQKDGYVVHYATFPSTVIPAEVAKAHGITRAESRQVSNISVLKDGMAVRAEVTGTAKNLLSQILDLEFLEVKEQESIYYLASIVTGKRDRLDYAIRVRPLASEHTFIINFQRRYE